MSNVLTHRSESSALNESNERLHGTMVLSLVGGESEVDDYLRQVTSLGALSIQEGDPDKVDIAEEATTSTIIVRDEFDEISYDPRRDEVLRVYPYISFTFNREWLLGKGVIPPTPDTRVRAVLAALHKEAPEIEDLDFRTANSKFINAKDYTKKKFKVDRETTILRSEVLSLEQATDGLFAQMARLNHPVVQLLDQLQNDFPELPLYVLRDIQTRLIVAVAYEDVISAYELAIAAAKSAAKESKTAN
jgi:hypothetical protein